MEAHELIPGKWYKHPTNEGIPLAKLRIYDTRKKQFHHSEFYREYEGLREVTFNSKFIGNYEPSVLKEATDEDLRKYLPENHKDYPKEEVTLENCPEYVEYVKESDDYMIKGRVYKKYGGDLRHVKVICNIQCDTYPKGSTLYFDPYTLKPSTKEAYDAQVEPKKEETAKPHNRVYEFDGQLVYFANDNLGYGFVSSGTYFNNTDWGGLKKAPWKLANLEQRNNFFQFLKKEAIRRGWPEDLEYQNNHDDWRGSFNFWAKDKRGHLLKINNQGEWLSPPKEEVKSVVEEKKAENTECNCLYVSRNGIFRYFTNLKKGYGFSHESKWVTTSSSTPYTDNKTWTKVEYGSLSSDRWFMLLENEAIKRGFIPGNWYEQSEGPCLLKSFDSSESDFDSGSFWGVSGRDSSSAFITLLSGRTWRKPKKINETNTRKEDNYETLANHTQILKEGHLQGVGIDPHREKPDIFSCKSLKRTKKKRKFKL